jgi:hypothetical protein
VTGMGKMGKEISTSRRERMRTRCHWHYSDGVRAVSGSTARVRQGCARLQPRSVCVTTQALGVLARWRKRSGAPGRLCVGLALGQLQSGLGCTVDAGWACSHSFQYSNAFPI